ncbi:MAG: ParB/RepB/Spo0J family partition protein [Nitrospiraceae bacterium]|nr:ParB/RepB/Spo0J family partition protein [Nitrospiraceae bacterium]
MAKKKGLGRGLSALIGGNAEATAPTTLESLDANTDGRVLELDPRAITPNPKQPRRAFHEEALEELAASIKRDGVQEPVIVREAKGGYELVSGERRVRATIIAGLDTVPAICRDVSDDDMLKLGLIENIQREDLNPIELAQAYQGLIEEFDWTQERLADEVGKKRVTVTNMLRLLNLPEDVQRLVQEEAIAMGHARALLSFPSANAQRSAARKVIEQGLSVRQTEKLAAPKEPKPPKASAPKDANIAHIEDDLRRRLGTKVSIRSMKKNRGKIEIEYFNLDELERILGVLRGQG